MNTEQELRPCPHCGMPVTLQTSKTLGDRLFVIACPDSSPCANSGLGTYVIAGKRDEAIAAWNRRSGQTEARAIVDEMLARDERNGFLTDWWRIKLDALNAALPTPPSRGEGE